MFGVDGIKLYKNDLPDDLVIEGDIAIDTEAMGLIVKRDRLCLVQIADISGNVYIVQFDGNNYSAPNLKKILLDLNREKIFHFARFDVAIMYVYLGIWVEPIYCTKIASRIARTYTSAHSLRELCNEILSVKLNKHQQCSNWGNPNLSKDQLIYAALDVIYLHSLRDALNKRLKKAGRYGLASRCYKCVRVIAELDVEGWDAVSLFNHSASHVS